MNGNHPNIEMTKIHILFGPGSNRKTVKDQPGSARHMVLICVISTILSL